MKTNPLLHAHGTHTHTSISSDLSRTKAKSDSMAFRRLWRAFKHSRVYIAVKTGKMWSTVGAPVVPQCCEQGCPWLIPVIFPSSPVSSARDPLAIIHSPPSPRGFQPNPRYPALQVLEPHSLIQIHTNSKQHVIPNPAQFLLLKATRGPWPGNLLHNATETAINSRVKAFFPPLQKAEIVVASLENTTNLLQWSFLAGSLLQSLSLLPAEC